MSAGRSGPMGTACGRLRWLPAVKGLVLHIPPSSQGAGEGLHALLQKQETSLTGPEKEGRMA